MSDKSDVVIDIQDLLTNHGMPFDVVKKLVFLLQTWGIVRQYQGTKVVWIGVNSFKDKLRKYKPSGFELENKILKVFGQDSLELKEK